MALWIVQLLPVYCTVDFEQLAGVAQREQRAAAMVRRAAASMPRRSDKHKGHVFVRFPPMRGAFAAPDSRWPDASAPLARLHMGHQMA